MIHDIHPETNSGSQTPPGAFHLRTIRSYVLRAGRTTTGQVRAFQTQGPTYLKPFQDTPIDLPLAFGRSAPTVLEIGFGMGDATAKIAQTLPEINFLCCEVHQPGVGALLKQIGEKGITNIRIVQHDAVQVLTHMLAPDQLAGIHIFFPDPWHKARHHKRRLIQPPLVAQLVTRLAPGGYLHCATDWQPYAEQILQVLSSQPKLTNTATTPDGFATKPTYRPLTKFENRGIKLGHGVWDLVFVRAATEPFSVHPTTE